MPLSPALRLAFVALVAVSACAPSRQVYDVTEIDRPPDVATDSLPVERARARITYVDSPTPTPDVAPARSVDILHTALDVRLDPAAQTVAGTATHTLVPIADDLGSFVLHAVGMDIGRVRALAPAGLTVSIDYDSTRLTVTPSRPLARRDTVRLEIAYTAHPMAGEEGALFGGRGMYFIDPAGTDPYRPTQIWTQGQTEDSRRWYPTWDYPNDKMTFEISVTVPDSMQTFSNGLLASSESAGGGLRRDNWVLEGPPMASYLAAVVAGEFAVVTDQYQREDGSSVPLSYIVEPRFAGDARRIFGETPRMIEVFEDFLGVRYPWPDYKQATVRDFTAGGLENTTLTVMHEGLQSEPRGWPSNENDARVLISHELAHQWLGDLTTNKDWANATINEGFATFMEAVYRELAFGHDAAQDRLIRDWIAYRGSAVQRRRPIVWHGYGDNEGLMYDTHTYHKGGRILGQLRFEVGDEVFRRGLTSFLTEYAGRGVEMADLRQSMEEASGRPLVRFFDQWFNRPGHPALDVEQAFFPGSGLYTIQVTQTQDPAREPTYAFDVLVELNHADGTREVHRERIAARDTTLRYSMSARPAWVRFDSGDHLPAEIALSVPVDELVAMARGDDEMAARYDALVALGELPQGPQAREALVAAAQGDAHPLARVRAIVLLEPYLRSRSVAEALMSIARNDADAEVREGAVFRLSRLPAAGEVTASEAEDVIRAGLTDEAYFVVGRAIQTYASLLPRSAYDAYETAGLFQLTTWGGMVEEPLAAALDTLGDARGIPWLTARAGDDNPDGVRAAAARALGNMARHQPGRGEEIRGTLLSLLDDRLSAVRLAVARGLAHAGTREDIPALEARLAVERVAEVRTALEGAIRRLRFGGGTQLAPPRFGDVRQGR